MYKNTLTKLLILLTVIIGVAQNANADAPFQYSVIEINGIKWELYDGGVPIGAKETSFRYMVIKDEAHKDVERVVIPDTIKGYYEVAAQESLRDLYNYQCEISGVVDVIGPEAFSCSRLKEITLPSTLKRIESRAFFRSSVQDIEIPAGVKEIGQEAFAHSGLVNIKINEGTEKLGWGCFEKCPNLRKIDLPSTLKEFSGRTFHKGWFEASLICRAITPPVADPSDFGFLQEYLDMTDSYAPGGCVGRIYVPAESVEAYKSAPGWEYVAYMIYPIEDTGDTEDVVEISEGENFPYTISGNNLYIRCHAGDSLSIFDANGMLIDHRQFSVPQTFTYSGEGVRIVTLNGKSIRVIL